MAKTTLTKNSTTGNWELTETGQGLHYTNTLQTAGKAIDGDIKIDITASDANLVAGNIKSGVSIFGVSGSYTAPSYATYDGSYTES